MCKIAEGYKQTEVGIIPSDWIVKRLGDCLLQNPDYGINAAAVPYKEELPVYLRITDITEDGRYSKNSMVSVNNIASTSFFLEKGEIVFARTGASVGKTYLYNPDDGRLVFAGFLIRVKTNPNVLNPNYLKYFTQTSYYWNWIRSNSMRTGQPGINSNEYKELSIPLPPTKAEQTAIATALNDADALITQLEKLIAKKRNIKQGAMQELLNPYDEKRMVNGELRMVNEKGNSQFTTRHLQLKKGWEVKKLGECLRQNPDYGVNAAAVTFNESLPVYLRITDITEEGRYSKKNIVSVSNINSLSYYLEKGDLVFARTGASVGKTYLYNTNDGKLVFAGFLIRIKTNSEILNPVYFQYYTQTSSYWNWIRANSMRTGQPGINGNEYKELVLIIPSIETQNRIAQILSDMDAEIEALEKKLEKYKMLKQGMMQNLLTGRVRLI